MSGIGGFGNPNSSGIFGANKPVSGFGSFGTPTNTTAGLTFGTNTFGNTSTGLFNPSQPSAGFGSVPPATGFGAAQPNTGFGQVGQTTGFVALQPTAGLGGSTSATGFNTAQPATSFGAVQPAPAFGVATPQNSATGFAFGAPSLGAPAFGVAAITSATSTQFGTSTPSISFGVSKATPPAGAAINLGQANTSFNFSGQNSNVPVTSAPAGSNFGFANASGLGLGLGLGLATAAATTPAAGAAAPAATTTTTTTVAVPASTATATITPGFTGFSQPSTTTTLTSLAFGAAKTTGGLTFGTSSAPSFSTATSVAPTFAFGLATTTSSGFSLGGTGLFGAKPTNNLSLSTATTTTTSVGLGGVDNSQAKPGLSGTSSSEPKQVKDNILPEPILQSLNDFQNFTKQQKSISVEISHGSSKPLKKVQEDIEALESLLASITSGLTRNAIAVDKLKTETAQGLHQAEMAQRNHETPPGLEYDNSAPAEYFSDLVTKFETDTVRLRVQIEASEKHLKSLTQSSTISPQELTLAMRRLHETLVVLAARVQTLHTTVQSQKEQYRNLRRVYLKDDSSIFEQDGEENPNKKPTIYSLRSLTGPTPFSETPGNTSLNLDGLAMLTSSTVTALVTTSSNPGWMTSLQGTTNTSSILPNSATLSTPQPTETTGFQLSKPPVGNKRNKR